MDDASAILVTAAATIRERATTRDTTAERSMARTVAAFNALHGTQLTELQGWQFMATLKMARAAQGTGTEDDYVDQAAYAALAGECAEKTRNQYPHQPTNHPDGPQYQPDEVAFHD